MILERSRKALNEAEEALARLAAADVEQFRGEFIPCIAMIQRVGPILDSESKGHRTHAFGAWWQITGQDPLFKFISDVRNAEFKRGEDRKRAEHRLTLRTAVTVTASLSMQHMRDGQVIGEYSSTEPPSSPASPPESTHTVTWRFVGGSYDGQEVFALLRQYLDWVRDVILPEGERLAV